jgi:hypothetical protein
MSAELPDQFMFDNDSPIFFMSLTYAGADKFSFIMDLSTLRHRIHTLSQYLRIE